VEKESKHEEDNGTLREEHSIIEILTLEKFGGKPQ